MINYIKILIISLVAYILLFLLFPIYSFIGLFLLIGIIIGSLSKKLRESLILGFAVSITGSIFASIFLTTEKIVFYMQTMPNSIVNRDTPMNLYSDVIFNLVKLNPIEYLGKLGYILISILLITFFSGLFSNIKLKKIALYIFLSILSLNFLITSINSSRGIIDYSSKEPPNYSYGYDALVYMKMTYLMYELPFYKSWVRGWQYDSRIEPPGSYENDQFKKGAGQGSFTVIKQPYIFYFWKYISLGNASRVVYFSILLCIFLLVLSYYSANKLIGNYAFIAPVFIYPYLFTGTTWANVFFPDWWTGLLLLLGLYLWIFNKPLLSSISFLFAAWARLTVLPILVLFAIFAFFKDRRALRPLLIVITIFIISMIIHYFQAYKIIHPSNRTNLYEDIFVNSFAANRVKQNQNLIVEYLASFSYLMFMYGFFKISPFVISITSFLFPIIKKRYDILIIVFYSVISNLIRTGTYWGQHTGAVVLFSVALLIGYAANTKLILKKEKKKKKKNTRNKRLLIF